MTGRRDIVEQEIDLEPEDRGERAPRAVPLDARKIRVTTKPWSLRQAVDDLGDGTIDLTPDFQRPSVWTPAQRSRLVESILLGIPLPAFYFSADRDGRMQVVDGVQRLSAIRDFANNELALDGLDYLPELHGKRWKDLEPAYRRRFQQTQILVNVVEPETPPEVKLDIFERINTGGEPLTAQELRHALSRDRSRALLARMVALPSFRQATGGALDEDRRMAARELALRFAALREDPQLAALGQARSVDEYLLDATARLDDPDAVPDDRLEAIVAAFDAAMRNAFLLFGEHAFRRWPEGSDAPAPINRALFESWSVVLADQDEAALAPRKDAIVAALRRALATDEAYVRSIGAGPADAARVSHRLELARSLVQRAQE